MKKHLGRIIVGVTAVAIAGGFYFFTTRDASAHENREVGDYEITFGWQVEPAYAGVFNGPEITITNVDTEEPLVGAEETLTLTVNFGPESKELALTPAWNEPGRYVAFLTPTRPGDYEFELTGTITEATALSETVVSALFTSSNGDFSTIEPSEDVLFPDPDSDSLSLQERIEDLETELEALKEEIAAMKVAE